MVQPLGGKPFNCQTDHLIVLGFIAVVFAVCAICPSLGIPIISPSNFKWRKTFFVSSKWCPPIVLFLIRLIGGLEMTVAVVSDFFDQQGSSVFDYPLYFSTLSCMMTGIYLLTAAFATMKYGFDKDVVEKPESLPPCIQWMWALGTSLFTSQIFLVSGGWWIAYAVSPKVRENFANRSTYSKAIGLHHHGIGALYMIAEIALANQPILFEHLIYPCIYTGLWMSSVCLYQFKVKARSSIHGPINYPEKPAQSWGLTAIGMLIFALVHVVFAMINRVLEGRPICMTKQQFCEIYEAPQGYSAVSPA